METEELFLSEISMMKDVERLGPSSIKDEDGHSAGPSTSTDSAYRSGSPDGGSEHSRELNDEIRAALEEEFSSDDNGVESECEDEIQVNGRGELEADAIVHEPVISRIREDLARQAAEVAMIDARLLDVKAKAVELDNLLESSVNNLTRRVCQMDEKGNKVQLFVCYGCGRSFTNAPDLQDHVNHVHLNKPEQRFKCSKCPKSFHKRHHWKNHEQTHDPNYQYVCDVCSAGFRKHDSLVIHKSRKHRLTIDGRPLIDEKCKCLNCLAEFGTKTELKWHQYHCLKKGQRRSASRSSGGTTSTNPSPALAAPVSSRLTAIGAPALVSPRQKLDHRCSSCNGTFASRQSLLRHIDRKHKEIAEQLKNEGLLYKSESSPNLPFACEMCGKRFASASSLTSHKRRHEGDRPHACELCGRSYPLPSELRKHMKRSHAITENGGGEMKRQRRYETVEDMPEFTDL